MLFIVSANDTLTQFKSFDAASCYARTQAMISDTMQTIYMQVPESNVAQKIGQIFIYEDELTIHLNIPMDILLTSSGSAALTCE